MELAKTSQEPMPTDQGWNCRVFYMRIKALYKKSGKADRAKKRVQETQNGQKPKRQLSEEEKKEASERILGRTAQLRRQVSLKDHR